MQSIPIDERAIGLVRIEPVSGAVRWRLSLGPWIFNEEASADGRLPRFVPISVFGSEVADGPIVREVVVVDLDEGTIAARERVDVHAVRFYTAERAFVMVPPLRRLVALDPTTGRLASVTRLDGIDALDVRPQDFEQGRLWSYGMAWNEPDALPWLVLDLAHVVPAHLHGDVAVHDESALGWAALRRH